MPFSFRTELNPTPANVELGRRIRSLSRLKYGQNCNIVEAEIFRRMYDWDDKESNKIHDEIMPVVVNPIVLELGYEELELPPHFNKRFKKHGLLTIGDIVHSSDTALIEKYGFSLENMQYIDKRLNWLGCCLPPGGAFSKKPLPAEDCEYQDFLWDDKWSVEVADSENSGGIK
jgi:hypothetical protein